MELELVSGANFGCVLHHLSSPSRFDGSRGQAWPEIGQKPKIHILIFITYTKRQSVRLTRSIVRLTRCWGVPDRWDSDRSSGPEALLCNIGSQRSLRSSTSKPYEFIGFGAMDVTKPYKFIGLGDQRSLRSYFKTLEPEIIDLGCRNGPFLAKNTFEKVGGFAPHLFEWVFGKERAVSTTQIDDSRPQGFENKISRTSGHRTL